MALPAALRVKISSEEGGYISLTPVVSQEIAMEELLERMLGITGKDTQRVREILERGTLVSGGSRFRWQGFAADPGDIATALAAFPGPDPTLPFRAERTVFAVLVSGPARLTLPRKAASERRLLRRRTFWDVLVETARSTEASYREYSYRERADVYRISVTPAARAQLRAGAGLLRYRGLREQIERAWVDCIEFYLER
jgi:hypothetical protein